MIRYWRKYNPPAAILGGDAESFSRRNYGRGYRNASYGRAAIVENDNNSSGSKEEDGGGKVILLLLLIAVAGGVFTAWLLIEYYKPKRFRNILGGWLW